MYPKFKYKQSQVKCQFLFIIYSETRPRGNSLPIDSERIFSGSVKNFIYVQSNDVYTLR